MNFDRTDEQKDIARAARAFAEKKFPEIAQGAMEQAIRHVRERR